jgi:hypothetical protein
VNCSRPVRRYSLGAAALLVTVVPWTARAQEPPPVPAGAQVPAVTPPASQPAPAPPLPKGAILTALKTGGLQPTELVEIISRRGLAFPMSVADEQELRAAGASDLVLDIMWSKEAFEIKPGPPLTREAIVASLQAGVPSRRLERMIRVRTAKVALSREVADEIKAAGGTDALLGTILANVVETQPVPPPTPQPEPVAVKAAPPEPSKTDIAKQYDELMAQAQNRRKIGNHGKATELLAEAKKLDAQRPEAYALTGQIWIESLGSVLRANTEFTSAIERNGEITVPALHTHGRSKTLRQKNCRGDLTISRTTVKFISSAGHNFAIEVGRIVDVGINSSKLTLGALGGGFHIAWTNNERARADEDFKIDIQRDDREAAKIVTDLIRKCLAH